MELHPVSGFGTFIVALIAFILGGGFAVETIQKRKRKLKI